MARYKKKRILSKLRTTNKTVFTLDRFIRNYEVTEHQKH
jgi:hypothetical protein